MFKTALLDVVHHPNYKITAFWKLDSDYVFRKMGKRAENPFVGPSG
jgi:hypothetical protein